MFKRTNRGVYFAMLKDSFGKWTFPKGHVRRGESYEHAAEREIFEEMGLSELRLKRRLGTIDIWFRDRFVFKGLLIHKFIHYYLFEAAPSARLRLPKQQVEGEKIQDVAWVPIAEVGTRSTYRDLARVITYAIQTFDPNAKLKHDRRGKKLAPVDRKEGIS